MKQNQQTQRGEREVPAFPLDFICERTRSKYECFSCSHMRKYDFKKNYRIRFSENKYNHNLEI